MDEMDVNRMQREKLLFLGVLLIKRINTYICLPWTIICKSLSPYFSGNSNLPSPKLLMYNISTLNFKVYIEMNLIFKRFENSGLIYTQQNV